MLLPHDLPTAIDALMIMSAIGFCRSREDNLGTLTADQMVGTAHGRNEIFRPWPGIRLALVACMLLAFPVICRVSVVGETIRERKRGAETSVFVHRKS